MPGPGGGRPWRDRDGRLSPLKAGALGVAFYPAVWSLYHLSVGGFGPLPLVGLIYWSGVWSAALLLAALAVTPISKLAPWPRLPLARRILGVAALAYAVAHVVIYAALYRWDFGFLLHDTLGRTSLLVAGASLLGLFALGATSFDGAVRRLGGRAWKRLHRANYALSGLALAHFALSPGIFTLQYVMLGLFAWLMGWRLLDRTGRGASPSRLLALTAIVWTATVAADAGWKAVRHGVDPVLTLRDNLTLAYGVSAGWWVLLAGLALSLGGPFARSSRRRLRPSPAPSGERRTAGPKSLEDSRGGGNLP